MTGRFLHGTSSWSEKSWSGVFYPRGLPPGEFLTHYATQFGAVEADVTYYRVPDRGLVDRWRARTPEGFRLCAKFPRSIVHAGDGPRPDGDRVLLREHVGRDLDAFLDAMGRLGERCGPLVLQFPYFNREAFGTAEPFLERLDRFLGELPSEFRYAVEVRNKAWMDAPLLELLRRRDAAFVWLDLAYTPPPWVLAQRLDLVTTDFVYARLIGDRKAVDARTKTFDAVVLDQSERLAQWADELRAALARVPEVYAFANNHYAGHGPATIRELAARVRGEAPPAETLREDSAGDAKIARPDGVLPWPEDPESPSNP